MRVSSLPLIYFFSLMAIVLVPLVGIASPTELPIVSKAFVNTHYDYTGGRTSFQPHEKIYLYLEFSQPIRNASVLSVQWITPTGELERNHSQNLKPTQRKDMIYFSWLKLIKEGMLTRNFTGEDYEASFTGKWRVLVYLNSQEMCELSFEMDII